MENLKQESIGGENSNSTLEAGKLSTGIKVYEFEFCSLITTNSAFGDPNDEDSPADRFFLNGKLLPHSFPAAQTKSSSSTVSSSSSSAATSRTSSLSSKDSLMWSRSSSVNTSVGQVIINNDHNRSAGQQDKVSLLDIDNEKNYRNIVTRQLKYQDQCNKYDHHHRCGSTRWRFIYAAAALDPSHVSRRRRSKSRDQCLIKVKTSPELIKGDKSEAKGSCNDKSGVWQRILRSIVATCKACHAMDRPVEEEEDFLGNDGVEMNQ
ncbi:hypothetical protein Dimus_018937 [Dionaea muscipula]